MRFYSVSHRLRSRSSDVSPIDGSNFCASSLAPRLAWEGEERRVLACASWSLGSVGVADWVGEWGLEIQQGMLVPTPASTGREALVLIVT